MERNSCVISQSEGMRMMFGVGKRKNSAAHILDENPVAMSHIEVYFCWESVWVVR